MKMFAESVNFTDSFFHPDRHKIRETFTLVSKLRNIPKLFLPGLHTVKAVVACVCGKGLS